PLHRSGAQGCAPIVSMQIQDFLELCPNGKNRVQAGGRVLENDSDLAAAHAAHLALRQAGQILVTQENMSGSHACDVRLKPEQGEGRHAIPAAGLAHLRTSFSPRNGHTQTRHSQFEPGFGVDPDVQVTDFEYSVPAY